MGHIYEDNDVISTAWTYTVLRRVIEFRHYGNPVTS